MKARNWLFLASFLIMMEGAMDISIYFIQYMWLGLRYVPNVPAQIHRANVLCIVYGGYGICLFIVGFLSGMVNYLVLLWDGRPIRDAVMSVITSLLLPGFFIHTAYLGRLEYAEELKYEDIGDDKDKDV